MLGGCGESNVDEVTKLNEVTFDKAIEEAVLVESIQKRNEIYYQPNKSKPYSGWVKEVYDSGQVKELFQVQDGKETGYWTWWYENGQKATVATKKDGKANGLCVNWHENGQKESEEFFKDGKEDGLATHWDENGNKVREVIYKEGEQISREDFVHYPLLGDDPEELDNVLVEAVNDDEVYSSYLDEGTPIVSYRSTPHKRVSGWVKTMYPNGKIHVLIHHKHGRWHGIHARWHENGQKWHERIFNHGTPEGMQREWNEDGKLTREATFKNGELISKKDL